MKTLSPRMAHASALGVKTAYVAANPLRRGPVVLATDGSSATGGPVVAAEMLAEQLGLPLSIISVLEPSPTFASSADVVITIDPAVDERRVRERETKAADYVARFAGGAAPAPVHVRVGGTATEIARFVTAQSGRLNGSAPDGER